MEISFRHCRHERVKRKLSFLDLETERNGLQFIQAIKQGHLYACLLILQHNYLFSSRCPMHAKDAVSLSSGWGPYKINIYDKKITLSCSGHPGGPSKVEANPC